MESSQKILIVAGMASLAWGFLLGFAFALARSKRPNAPRYLVVAHIGALMQGTMMLGLAVAAGLSTLTQGAETLAAWLLVAFVFAVNITETANWLGRVQDQFAQRPPQIALISIAPLPGTVGLVILGIGVLRAI